MLYWYFNKDIKIIQRIVNNDQAFSTNGIGRNGYPLVKSMRSDFHITPYIEHNEKGIKDLV
jgi:hypothetical protein